MAPTADHDNSQIVDVFLSHAGEQKFEFVSHVRAKFKDVHPNVQVFVDDWSLNPGQYADENMERGMDECGVGKHLMQMSW
jgi:hypothetical protein